MGLFSSQGKRVAKKRKSKNKKPVIVKIVKAFGFTNCLAVCIVLLLVAGLAGGFLLAWRSITYNYMGALACWSVCFTPIGTVAGIVLNSIVRKSETENSGADGEGIKYAMAKANGFAQMNEEDEDDNSSPAI